MTRVACLHHLAQPFLGLAERPLRAAGLELVERDLGTGDPLPALDEVDAILSYGGAQSATALADDPVLTAEAELLRDAVDAGVPVFGICLGAQLLAASLGAEVRRARRRTVAWHELEPTAEAAGDPIVGALPRPVRGLHWNEDVFELPEGAVELLGPRREGVEAFRFGECAWGVQFHPEVDGDVLEGWYATYGEWLAEAGVSEQQARADDARHLPAQRAQAERLFAAFASVVAAAPRRVAVRPRA
ncbi:MAG TPA: type 1 glutamine amidotransferase [Solirubrobacteraceae bacterium]|jgi:GMP synthase (glutamine-hydrolysing)|nr:type 1 glutamine amidotransferase [Solirubrobacteraceae bacterium]